VADDPSIPNDSRLFRRIPADTNHIIWDGTAQAYRISSQAFRNLQDNPPAFSVNLDCVLQQHGLGPDSVIIDPTRYGIVALPVALVRTQGQAVERHPEPGDPSHGHVVGNKTSGVKKAFVRAVTQGQEIQWVIPPPGWPWPPNGTAT
jgi:hypothetical protein